MKRLLKLLVAVSLIAFLAGIAEPATDAQPTGSLVGKIEVSKGKKDENTIIYLKGVSGTYTAPPTPAVLDQKQKVFIPHLLPVQKGQTVHFKNSDSLTHNIHLYWGRRSMLNKSQAPDGSFDWTPRRAGEYLILCNIHPEMMAAILVLDHPFFSAVSSSQFKIENIPAGTYTLVAVRDVRGDLKERETQVSIENGKATRVTIKF